MGDAMFEAAPGSAFGDLADGVEEHGPPKYLGHHGQRAFYPDNHALFVAAGPTIRRGVQLPVIRRRDIAPTVAGALGVGMEGGGGGRIPSHPAEARPPAPARPLRMQPALRCSTSGPIHA